MAQVNEDAGKEREVMLAAYEAAVPGVYGNPYIPHWPTQRQALFLGAHVHPDYRTDDVFECLYGGAAGGGKSDSVLMAAAQYAWKCPDFAAILIRKTFKDLNRPGALMDRAISWWKPLGVHWNHSDHMFTFPSGARVQFGYLDGPNDHLVYQGAEFQLAAWDELTQWEAPRQYEFVGLSRVRRNVGSEIPLRCLSTSNPGGPGHEWVRNKFVGGPDDTGMWQPPTSLYIPATIRDNPHIDQAAYIKTLERLHPTARDQLLNGDWRAREPGDYFRREWFGPFIDLDVEPLEPPYAAIRWWDLAASEKPDAARTAGVLMVRMSSGVRIITHATAFRATPGQRDSRIVQQARLDGHHVVVGLEIEPGSGGIAQYEALAKRLRKLGFRVEGARPRVPGVKVKSMVVRQPVADKGKVGRADPVASCLERGYQRRGEGPDNGLGEWGADLGVELSKQRDGLRIAIGAWTQPFLDEVEGFPEAVYKDRVDATSGAWAWLEENARPAPLARPREPRKADPNAYEVHPDDRQDRAEAEKDRAGLWRPC